MYKNVHFNIISAYDYETGFPDQASADAFKREITDMFKAAGWQIQMAAQSHCNDKAVCGKSELSLHPMDVCGIISEELIPEVESFIKQATTFRHNATRVGASYVEMDDAAYRQYLDSRREEIQAAVLTHFQTRRRNLFKTGDQSEAIARPFMLNRMESKDLPARCYDLSVDYVRTMIEEMVSDGRLTASPTRYGRGLRTTGVTKPPKKRQRESR